MCITKIKMHIIWLIAFGSSIISALFMFNTDNENTYQWLICLPLAYGFMALPCAKLFNYITRSKVIAILVFGYFVKMVLSPLLFAIGGYQSFFYGYTSIENINIAILFMIYEYIIVFFITTLSLRNRNFCFYTDIESEKYSGSKRLLFGVIIICIFIIFAYNYVPEIKNIYFLISDYKVEDLVGVRWDNETIVARGSIQRYIYSLFMFLWPLVRFLLPTVLIHLNYQKRGDSRTSILISSVLLVIPFLLLGGDNLAPFIAALFALIVIVKLYGRSGKRVAIVFGIIGAVIMTGMIIGKLIALTGWRGATGVINLAQMLNSYFPGFDNTAIALGMDGNNKLSTLMLDLSSGIPFIGSFINFSGDTLNDIFIQAANTGGQIVPWGCGIGYYFSYILSPIITSGFVWFLLYKEEKSNLTTDFWTYYCNMIFSVYSAFSIIIYSTQIYMRFIWNIMIPVLLIIVVSRARGKKNIHVG